MLEWKDPYNSFNSYIKGMYYLDWYKSIREWKDGLIKAPKAPVEISLDPFQFCQLKCSHCNASRYLLDDKKPLRIDDDKYLDLIRFFAKWGAKAICHGGGGEPTLHTGLWEALELASSLGLENSIATNGINFNDKTIDIAVKNCRWIGVSVDSATKETYLKGRGIDCFDKTIESLKKLSLRAKELNTNCDVSMKFLLFQYNQHEIFEACKLAKEIGVKDFHARPADLSHVNMHEQYKVKTNPYNLELIEKQFEQCHEIETKDFRVITAVHKFDKNFMPIKYFEQCYASPCCLQICPDGNCYLCPDQRYQEFYKLGSWNPNPEAILEFWGSQKHYDLVFKHGKKACNTRCTFNPYNTMCERLAINDNDPVCWKFI